MSNALLATEKRVLDPYSKQEEPATDEDKIIPTYRPSDMSQDDDDERCRFSRDYSPMRDPDEFQRQEQAKKREEEKARKAAERDERRRQAAAIKAQKEELAKIKRKARAAAKEPAGDKAAKKGGKKPKKPAGGQKPDSEPAPPPEPLPDREPTPPPPPPARPKRPRRVGAKKTHQEWRDIYQHHSQGKAKAAEHLSEQERAELDTTEDILSRRWTAEGKRDLTCPRCKHRGPFSNFTALKDHYNRRHRDLKLFPCDECPKEFAKKTTLTAHKKYHRLPDEEK